jgi:hypothetical protein
MMGNVNSLIAVEVKAVDVQKFLKAFLSFNIKVP